MYHLATGVNYEVNTRQAQISKEHEFWKDINIKLIAPYVFKQKEIGQQEHAWYLARTDTNMNEFL